MKWADGTSSPVAKARKVARDRKRVTERNAAGLPPSPSKTKEAKAAYMREWCRKHPGHKDKAKLKAYGLTIAAFNVMLSSQGGVCASCKQPEINVRHGRVQALSVDHDHDTGAVRALLCSRCNVALGLLNDSVCRVENLLFYLKAHKG